MMDADDGDALKQLQQYYILRNTEKAAANIDKIFLGT